MSLIRIALILSCGCAAAACTRDDAPWDASAGDAAADAAVPIAEPECEGFELAGDTARDLSTGLVWDRFVRLSFASHEEALALCNAKGARLPTRAELLALRDPESADGCQLPSCPFYGDRCATIQCGSSVPATEHHWGVAFSGGALVMVPGGQAEALLCVR